MTMEDRFDGKKLSDLGFSADRIEQLRGHVSGLDNENFGGFGYSANTEHHFQELDDPTSDGSIEADMRMIGKHLGYEHAGTLNQDKVKDFIMENATPDEVTPPTEFDPKTMEMSPEYAKARAKVAQFQEDRDSGRSAEELYGTGETSNFLEDYKLRLGKKTKRGTYKPNKAYPEG